MGDGSDSTTSYHTGSIFFAGHLDSVSSETSIRDIADRCRVWDSHADSDARRFSKSGPDRALPIYIVDEPGWEMDDRMVAAVTTSPTAPEQLETLLRRLLSVPVVPPPPPKPVPSALERLLVGAQAPKPVPLAKTGITNSEILLQGLLPGIPASAARTQPGPMRRDWATVVCASRVAKRVM